jgi:hypothetical protein
LVQKTIKLKEKIVKSDVKEDKIEKKGKIKEKSNIKKKDLLLKKFQPFKVSTTSKKES